MKRKTILIPLIILLVASLILLLNGCNQTGYTYGIVGTPAVSDDGQNITVLLAESQGTTRQVNGGYRSTDYNTSYWLKQYEAATGKLVQKKKIVSSAEKNNLSALCYGSYADKIWVHTNGLKAYSLSGLEEVMNEEKLAAANNIPKNSFPYDQRLITAAVENGFIDFRADDGETFRILLKDCKIINKKEVKYKELNDGKTGNQIFNTDDDYGVRCDTFINTFFALAKDHIAAGNNNLNEGHLKNIAYQLNFFKGDYSIRRLGNHNSLTVVNMKEQGKTTYLNPCFAKDYYSGKAIHLFNPEGYLIIHQDVAGSKAKAIITRIDTHNKKIWETFTGVSTKIAHCILKGKYCIISTNTDYMFSPHIGKDAMCIVDTETGAIIKPGIKD